jgi:hypothetical protein
MRELTKSMTRYGWAMSVFGVQQMVDLMNAKEGFQNASESFNRVSGAAADSLSGSLKSVYRAGDEMQARVVDLFMTPLVAMDPNRWMRAGATAARQTASATQQAAQSVMEAAGHAAQATADAASKTSRTTTPD